MLEKVYQRVKQSLDFETLSKSGKWVGNGIFEPLEAQLVRNLGYKLGIDKIENITIEEKKLLDDDYESREIRDCVDGMFDEQALKVGKVKLWVTNPSTGKSPDAVYLLFQNDVRADKALAIDISLEDASCETSEKRAALPKDVAGIYVHEDGLIQAIGAPEGYGFQELPIWSPDGRQQTLRYPTDVAKVGQTIFSTFERNKKQFQKQNPDVEYLEIDPQFVSRLSKIIFLTMQVYKESKSD